MALFASNWERGRPPPSPRCPVVCGHVCGPGSGQFPSQLVGASIQNGCSHPSCCGGLEPCLSPPVSVRGDRRGDHRESIDPHADWCDGDPFACVERVKITHMLTSYSLSLSSRTPPDLKPGPNALSPQPFAYCVRTEQ